MIGERQVDQEKEEKKVSSVSEREQEGGKETPSKFHCGN